MLLQRQKRKSLTEYRRRIKLRQNLKPNNFLQNKKLIVTLSFAALNLLLPNSLTTQHHHQLKMPPQINQRKRRVCSPKSLLNKRLHSLRQIRRHRNKSKLDSLVSTKLQILKIKRFKIKHQTQSNPRKLQSRRPN